tara:strand:- start:8921 stop:10441 length:1521 start_codon:yes stop_codon:yes gene_type:complete
MSELPDIDIPIGEDDDVPPEETPSKPLTVDERNDPIKTAVGEQATGKVDLGVSQDEIDAGFTPSLGSGEREWTDLEEQDEEMLDTDSKLLSDEDLSLDVKKAGDAPQTDDVTRSTLAQIDEDDVERISGSTGAAAAAVGTIDSDNKIDAATVIDDRSAEERLQDGTLAQVKTQELAQEATAQYQLSSIMNALDGSAEMPAWASSNIRRVKAIMNQRGLGGSSMASAAMVQALMESAIPIAEADAQRYSTIQLKNLDNEQKTALHNATITSNLDIKNLDNRMKAAKHNADAFLQMDLKNLDNEQIANNLTYKAKQDALTSDQAAANLAVQLNVKSENDANQFYDEIDSQIAMANDNRTAAQEQFNVDQENSMTKYEAKLQDARDKFNANMQLLVDQSNALWRRNINTINNQGENAANQANAAAFLGITLAAQNQLWQQYRDEANMAFTAGENDESRALQLTLTSIANQFAREMFDKEIDFEDTKASGALLADFIDSVLDVGVDWLTN